MFIPGFLIALVTFPGVIAHEYAHERACKKRHLIVTDVCYFQLRSPNGFVKHEQPRRYADAFWISVAPFAFNTALAVAVAIVAGVFYFASELTGISPVGWLAVLGGWIAVSLAWHAFPSKHDAENVWRYAKREWRSSWFARLGFPVVVVLYICHYLSYVWFDAVYALAVVGGTIWGLAMLAGQLGIVV